MTWKDVYETWNQYDNLEHSLRQELDTMQNNPQKLEDAFYAPLEFGTAGLRGILGVGINRMNIYTIRQAAEGLALFIDTLGEEAKKRGVAIAYDSRHQSPEFAMESAKTLAYHGIKAYVFESLRPTPELSFAVRELNCVAGIMITASHNPSNYNGFKVYGEDGGQMPPKDADTVTRFVRSIENPLTIPVSEKTQSDKYIQMIGDALDSAYLNQMKQVTINETLTQEKGKDLNMVFTPLHGTGQMLGEKALKQAGFTNIHFVEEQSIPDPNFSTVHSPNPEEASAFEYAMNLGQSLSADLLVATDPDADRLGAAVRLPNGEYKVLSGNQLGSLMTHYIITQKKAAGTLAESSVVVKSIVSSELPAIICDKNDVQMENVLTGFKFISEKIKEYETQQSKEFIFGFEESYGYLTQPFSRDKDAIQALVLLAEIATYYMDRNQTLYDALEDIYKEYGYFEEKTLSITKQGVTGLDKIKSIMTQLRNQKPESFAGNKVSYTEDYIEQSRYFSNGKTEPILLPKADVLKFFLEDGTWIAVRPSGTEPKIKFYIGVQAESAAQTNQKLERLTESLVPYYES